MNLCLPDSWTGWLLTLILAGNGAVIAQENTVLTGPPRPEPAEVFSEADEEVVTDRDSFTPATTVVSRGRTVLEWSYSFIDNPTGADTHSFPEILTRIGITERMEVCLGWNYEIGGGGFVSNVGSPDEEELPGGEKIEEGDFLYGLKVLLTQQNDWLPQSALIIQANTPTTGPENATQLTTGYVFGWTFPNKWVLDSSLRYSPASEEGDHFNQWAPSIVLKVPVGEKWKAHVEYFGIFSDDRENEQCSQYFSPGIHYLLTRDFEIGLRTGWGLGQDSADFFSNIGAGVQF